MSRFESLSQDKITIMMKLLESQELCKVLIYNDTNFLDQPDIANPPILIYDRIYPHRFVPDTSLTMKSYITLSFGNYKAVNNAYKSGLMYISCFTHQSLFKTDYGVLRPDYMLHLIDKQVNGLRDVGIGGVQFHKMDELYVNEMYSGNVVVYKLYDFN